MKAPSKIRVAMIGAWGHGLTVLHALNNIPDEFEVVAMAPALPDDKPAEALKSLGICARAELFSDPKQLFAKSWPDVAVISARLDRIASCALEAARAGCPFIGEKPLALQHEDLESVWQAVRQSAIPCSLILDNRAHPVLRAARQAVQEGLIGRVALCNARKSYPFDNNRPAWFGRRALYGGTIPWLGIHAVDFIEAATGLNVESVAAMQGNLSHTAYPDCEDHAGLLAGLTSGAHATISLDFLRSKAAPSYGDDWLRVVGTRGIIEAYLAKNTCTLMTENRPPTELPLPGPTPWMTDTVRALARDPASLRETTWRAFHFTHACLCARDAADQGKLLKVSPWPNL